MEKKDQLLSVIVMKRYKTSAIIKVAASVLMSFWGGNSYAVNFNTDVLDAADKQNIDFSRFSQAGYIMPGQYQLQLQVNDQSIDTSSIPIFFFEPEKKDTKGANNNGTDKKAILPEACLTPNIVSQLGLTVGALDKVTYWRNGECADFSALPGAEFRPNMADGMLFINIPQAWLEYTDASWLPPSRWDNGISGLLFDYNLNATVKKTYKGQQSQSVGYNGTSGANFGAWRFRADYQGNYNHSGQKSQNQFDWNRFYMYRAIPSLQANLTLGENYINSDIFNSWRYTGVSLVSDDRMLPPNIRGYAPEVSGIAYTNARVVVSQQGRVLYDSTVPAGPFTIQDLDSSVRGRLDVEVIEQNGQKKTFQVDTAYVPYLTRPGQITNWSWGAPKVISTAWKVQFLQALKPLGG